MNKQYVNDESNAVNYYLSTIESKSDFRQMKIYVEAYSENGYSLINNQDMVLQYTGSYYNVDSMKKIIDINNDMDTNRVRIFLYKKYKRVIYDEKKAIIGNGNYALYTYKKSRINAEYEYVRIILSNGFMAFDNIILIKNDGEMKLTTRVLQS